MRLSKFEFDILHGDGIEHQAADALLHLKINGEDKISLEDEVPVLTISQAFFACALQTGKIFFEFIEGPKGPCVYFIPKICMMASISDNEKADIPTLAEFITAQFTDADCYTASTTVENRNTFFNVNRDGVLVRVFPLDGESQQVVHAS